MDNTQIELLLKNIKEVSLPLYVIVTEQKGKPCIELRKCITKFDTIKQIVSCAYHRVPITIMPEFRNSLQSIGSLVDKGIIYKGNDNKLYFTF